MQALLVALAIVAVFVLGRVEGRLWRTGRIGRHLMTILVLAQFPLLVLLIGLVVGDPQAILLPVAVAIAILPGALMYGILLSLAWDAGLPEH